MITDAEMTIKLPRKRKHIKGGFRGVHPCHLEPKSYYRCHGFGHASRDCKNPFLSESEVCHMQMRRKRTYKGLHKRKGPVRR